MATSNPGPALTTQNLQIASIGNIMFDVLIGLTISPASVAANTTAEQQFTLTGLIPGDIVAAIKPAPQAGLATGGTRTVSANTIGITFINATASPIVPTAGETYTVFVRRPMPQYIGNLPTSLPI